MEDEKKGHELTTVNFYDADHKEKHFAKVAKMLDEGWYVEAYNVHVMGGNPYHSFLLMKGPESDPPNAGAK